MKKSIGTKTFLKSLWTISSTYGENIIIFNAGVYKYIWHKNINQIKIFKSVMGDYWWRDDIDINNDLNQDEVFEIIKEHYENISN